MYKYDTHVHTSEVSRCGVLSAEETVRLYKDAGYTGICITDHYIAHFFAKATGTWHDRADAFLHGYRAAREVGGLDVLLGAEIRFDHYGINDYLIYGLTEDIIYEYPELHRLSLSSFRAIADKHNLLVFQAHPMRNDMTIEHIELLDGMEGYNGNPRHDSRNEHTVKFANGRGLPIISGSDCHQLEDVARGGIVTEKRITTSPELADIIRAGVYENIIPPSAD